MHLGLLRLVILLAPAALLLAQEPHAVAPAAPPATHGRQEPATHRADARLSPAAILALVEARLAKDHAAPPEFVRPAGLPRHAVAILGCADLPACAAACLRLPASEARVVANAGGDADLGAVEVLERAVARGEVRLIVTLAHEGCACLLEDRERLPATSAKSAHDGASWSRAEQRALARRSAAAAQARAHHVPLVRAHAQLQRDLLLASSDVLRSACAEGRLLVVAASARGPEHAVQIHAHNRDRQGVAVVEPSTPGMAAPPARR